MKRGRKEREERNDGGRRERERNIEVKKEKDKTEKRR